MPKKLEKIVKKLEQRGFKKDSAYAIGTSVLQKSGQMKKAKKKKGK